MVNEYFGYFPVLLEFLGISEREVQHILNLYRRHGKQNCSIDFLLDDAVFGHADIWLRTTIAAQKAFDPTSCLIHQVGIWSHEFLKFCALPLRPADSTSVKKRLQGLTVSSLTVLRWCTYDTKSCNSEERLFRSFTRSSRIQGLSDQHRQRSFPWDADMSASLAEVRTFVHSILYRGLLLRGHAQSCSKLQWLQMNPTFIELRGIQIVLHTVQASMKWRASYIYIYISVRLYCMICNQVSVFHKIGWEHESMEIFPPPNYLNEHRCFDPDDLGENRDAGAQRFKCAGIVGNQGNLWI